MIKNWLWIVVFLGLTACGDFLEPKSETLFIPRTVEALNEMLLGEGYPRNINAVTVNGGMNLLDDDICCTSFKGTLYISEEKKSNGFRYIYSWQPDMFTGATDNGVYKGVWEFHYQGLLGANSVLDYVDGVSGSFDERTSVKAQAYALRAFYFFNLVNYFGEPYNYNKKALGIPLKTTAAMEEKDIARNTVEEVYDQIIKDLNEAERLYMELPENLQSRSDDLRTSLPMVQLLKSRVYLYMENWKEAARYARKVVEEWSFLLYDLKTLTVIPAPSRTYVNFIVQENPEVIWLFGCQYDNLIYGSTLTTTDTKESRKIFNASPDLVKGFKEGDLRKEWYLIRESYKYDDVFLPLGKNTTSTTPASTKFSQAFRLSEAYLNLAEAAAMDKDEVTALWALNELRDKRFKPESPEREVKGVTGSDLVNKIREERRLELCYEYHRWFDLRRYGMPSIKHVWNVGSGNMEYVLQEKDPGYTLPIPNGVMDKNGALVQNKLAPQR